MIHFGAIQIKVGRILRMHAALIEGIGGPSRTETEHHQPRFGEIGCETSLAPRGQGQRCLITVGHVE